MAVSKRLRYEVLRRDGHACCYCGAAAPEVKLTVDHVVPVALGGKDVPENLVTACESCNSGKSSSSPDAPIVANVADDALRWARAMSMATELAQRDRGEEDRFLADMDKSWQSAFVNDAATPEQAKQAIAARFYRDDGWQQSLLRLRAAGLSIDDFSAIFDDVMPRNYIENGRIWRYFCGACWKALQARQDTARRLIDSGEVA